jgi:hypothetical protein
MFYSYNTIDRWEEEDWFFVWEAETFFYGFLKELALDRSTSKVKYNTVNKLRFALYAWRLWRQKSRVKMLGNIIKLIRIFFMLFQGIVFVNKMHAPQNFHTCFKRSFLLRCIKSSATFRSQLETAWGTAPIGNNGRKGK